MADIDLKNWLKELARSPEQWVESSCTPQEMKKISKKMSKASRVAGVGTRWEERDNDANQTMIALVGGKDWLYAGDEVHYGIGAGGDRKRYATSQGIAGLILSST